MTVSSEISEVSYGAPNTTGPFPVPFYFLDARDLLVIRRYGETEDKLILTSQYTVTGAGQKSGGSVTLQSALAPPSILVIKRDPAVTQDAAYVEHAKFPAQSHERALDKATMVDQRTRDLVKRTLRMRDTDIPGAGAFDAQASRIRNASDPISTNTQDVSTVGWVLSKLASLGQQTLLSLANLSQAALINKVARWIDIRDYNLDGPGLVAALNAAKAIGLVRLQGESLTIAADVTLPRQCGINGGAMPCIANIDSYNPDVSHDFARGAIKLDGGVIRMDAPGCYLDSMTILRKGLNYGVGATSGSSTSDLNAFLASFSGVALQGLGIQDARIKNVNIYGFDKAIDFRTGTNNRVGGRLIMENVGIDCRNGVRYTGAADTAVFRKVHVWPWTTFNTSNAQRSGYGFMLGRDDTTGDAGGGNDEGSCFEDCLTFGYQIGFDLVNAAFNLSRAWADNTLANPGDIAYRLRGNCNGLVLSDCFSIHHNYGVAIDCSPSVPGGHPVWIHIQGGSFGGMSAAIGLTRGNLIMSGRVNLSVAAETSGSAIFIGKDFGNLVAELGTVECNAPILNIHPEWHGEVIDITLPPYGGFATSNAIANFANLPAYIKDRLIIRGANLYHGGTENRIIRPLAFGGPDGRFILEKLANPGLYKYADCALDGNGSVTFRQLNDDKTQAYPIAQFRIGYLPDGSPVGRSPVFPLGHVYASNTAAAAGGEPVGAFYLDSNGFVKQRI